MTERLLPREKLRRRADYQHCYQRGRRRHGTFATLHFVPNPLGHPRLGITATRRVGPAVVRNRAKRRVREIYRRWDERQRLPSLDLVVHLKPEVGNSHFDALREDLLRLLAPLIERGDRTS